MEYAPPLVPYLVISDAASAIDFYKKAFGAKETQRHLAPGTEKIMHARLEVNGAVLMLSDDFSKEFGGSCNTPEVLGGSPVTLHLHLADVDSFWKRAVEAGAIVTMPLADQFWGDRYGQLADPFGHKWSLGQTKKILTLEELNEAAAGTFKPSSSAPA